MIRKIIFTCSLLLGFTAFRAEAQCNPDTTLKSPGYKPDTLAHAQAGVAYNEGFTVLTPRDTKVYIGNILVNVTVDSIVATGVYGLPSGINYACQNPGCVFVWNEPRCIAFTGTCNVSAVYPLTIPVIAYAKLGTTPISRPDTIRRFSIIVDPDLGNIVIDRNATVGLKAYPNPAAGYAMLYHPALNEATQVKVFDLRGRECAVLIKNSKGFANLNLMGLLPGVYTISALGQSCRLLVEPR